MKEFKRKEQRKLIISFVVSMFLASILTILIFTYQRKVEKQYYTMVESRLCAITELKIRELVQWRKERLADAKTLFLNPSLSYLVKKYLAMPGNMAIKRELLTWVTKYQKEFAYNKIFLLDTMGLIQMSAPDSGTKNSATLVQNVINSRYEDKIKFADFYKNEYDKKIYTALIIPVLDDKASLTPLGTIVMRVDPDNYLNHVIGFWPDKNRSAETILYINEGDSVCIFNKLKCLKNSGMNIHVPLSKTELPVIKAVFDRKGIVYGKDYRGVQVVAMISGVPDTPWFVVTKIDFAEINESMVQQFRQMLLVLSIFLLTSGALLFLILSKRSKGHYREKIQALSEAAEKEKSHCEVLLKLQTEIETKEKILSTIFNLLPIGISVLDTNDQIVYSNPALEKIIGITREGLVFRDYAKRKYLRSDGTPMPKVEFASSRASRDRKSIMNVETGVQKEDGTIVWTDVCAIPVDFANWDIIIITIDITEMKNARAAVELHQKEIIHADKMASLGRIVAGVAHEINNPNNFVMLNAPLLKKGWESLSYMIKSGNCALGDAYVGKMKLNEYLEYMFPLIDGILEGSRRISRIVTDLKDYARPDLGEMKGQVDFIALINSAVNLMRNTLTKKSIDLCISIGEVPVMIPGNFQRLEQVVINLLQNSCDAISSSHDRFINISLDTGQEDSIQLCVHDTGCGITQNDLPHITEPFFTTKRANGGTGLGLSVSSKIIAEHGGQLLFKSEVGKGTTTNLKLPRNFEKK